MNKLARTFKSVKGKPISDKTIKNYIDYLIDSFLISKTARYDIKGKKYISSPSKYYFEDGGLVEHFEAAADGKRGKKQLEVDFVATRGSEKFSGKIKNVVIFPLQFGIYSATMRKAEYCTTNGRTGFKNPFFFREVRDGKMP